MKNPVQTIKQSIFILIVSTLLFSCHKKEKDVTVISGKIDNIHVDSIFLIQNKFKKAFAVKDGSFRDTLKILHPGYYEFYAGNERTELFLGQGDSLYISTDMFEFDEKLNYKGNWANENNYLAQKQLKIEKLYSDPEPLFSALPNDFRSEITSFKSDLIKDLEKANLNSDFQTFEKKNIDYFCALIMEQYPESYSYFKSEKAIIPTDFYEEFKTISFDNEDHFKNIPLYKDLVFYNLSKKMTELKSPAEIEKLFGNINSSNIREAAMENLLLYFIESGHADAERYNSFIQNNTSNTELKTLSSNALENVQMLLPGKPSPKFNYPDINGKNVSLDDLKGSLVYIDVWATWCGPCIREIPALKELEKNYSGKNVKFVSMSIDPKSDFDKWQNMVKEKDLKGIQIFADNDWKSTFVQEYGIKGIPRFILVDAEGNILQADAPRPSDPEIRNLIEANL